MKNASFVIKPANKRLAPRYPGHSEPACIAKALHGSIWRSFSTRTIALTALFSASFASTGGRMKAADDEEKTPVSVDMDKVQEVIKKYLGEEIRLNGEEEPAEGTPADRVCVERLQSKRSPIASNPDYFVGEEVMVDESKVVPLKGMVATTSINEAALMQAVKELFALYGVNLKDDVAFNGGKVAFEADGFDKTKNIGFELASANPAYYAFDGTQWSEVKETDEQFLTPEEIKTLDELVKKNKANVLVLPRESYTQQGVSEFIIKKAFLRSVLDYLEWLRASGKL